MNSTDKPRRGWRFLRRLLLTLAILATVTALFYTEEDWRGKRDWDHYKNQLEAQGWVLDWKQRVPKPVPDDQNFFMASTNIRIRFVKTQNDTEYAAATNLNWLPCNFIGLPVCVFGQTNPLIVAEISVTTPDHKDAAPAGAATAVDLRDTTAGVTLRNLIRQHVGQELMGSAGFHLFEKDLKQLTPAQIVLIADAPQTDETLSRLIPPDLATNIGAIKIENGNQPGQFEITLMTGRITPAADYLQWSEQFTPAFDEIRGALKRPYALIPGDYSQPWDIPIPNFVTLRWIAQSVAMRAQCHLLLQAPGKAVEDLALIHNVCRILEHQPDGHPMTLVEAMINVAIQDVHVTVVQDGLHLHAWREPDLAAIQWQLQQTDLHPPVLAAFEDAKIAAIHSGERSDFMKTVLNGLKIFNQPITFQDHFKAWEYWAMPRGWVYENVRITTELFQKTTNALSRTNQQVYPAAIAKLLTEASTALNSHSPFILLDSVAFPNFAKAYQTYAYNQTLVNEGQIVCALERYKITNGIYPDTLDKLTSGYFIETLPADVIGGQPLHYRRTDDGGFLLYSVGWNEADDGGIVVRDSQGKEDRNQGDWVWRYPMN